MLIELRRDPSANGCTLGSLYIDGQFECFTLEDVVREVPGVEAVNWKIPCETAIPSGIYRITITKSLRFHKMMPQLMDVPGFSGVRIHCGNCADDTEGCILLGRRRGTATILDSRLAFNTFFPKLQAAIGRGEEVTIRVANPEVTVPQSQTLRT